MASLTLITPDRATGVAGEIFRQVEAQLGQVPLPLQLFGVSPFLLEGQMRNIGHFMQHPRLDAAMLTLLRYLVAEREQCAFCIDFNRSRLLNSGWSLEQIRGARDDLSATPLSEAQRVMLALILKTVRERTSLTVEDVDSAKAQGFSEQDLLEGVFAGILAQSVDRLMESFSVGHE